MSMDFWSREVDNSFDSLFDMNHDGVLDPVEQGYQLEFLERSMEEDSGAGTEDELDPDLDWDELEMMDEDERREALEDAGYDPDDF